MVISDVNQAIQRLEWALNSVKQVCDGLYQGIAEEVSVLSVRQGLCKVHIRFFVTADTEEIKAIESGADMFEMREGFGGSRNILYKKTISWGATDHTIAAAEKIGIIRIVAGLFLLEKERLGAQRVMLCAEKECWLERSD